MLFLFQKDKLTFDAVPTEDGPFCDSSQLHDNKTEQEESKVFSISLDDIENEYLTIVDKKANFSVKYGDFLTNCDLMDMDSLNQINEKNQTAIKGLCELAANPMVPKVPKDRIPSKRPPKIPLKRLQPLKRKHRQENTTQKDTILQGNVTINQDNTVDISNLIEISQTAEDQNSLNLVLNVSHVPIEFESRKSNEKFQENKDQAIDLKALDESRLLNKQPFEVEVLDESKEQPFDVKVFDEPKLFNDQSLDVNVLDEPKLLNKQSFDVAVLGEPKPSNNNADKRSIQERKKIRIISEKKISEPVSLIGKLEPVSPSRLLTFPNKRRFINPNPLTEISDVPINNSNSETSLIASNMSKHNIILEQPEIKPINIVSSTRDNVSPQDMNDAINIIQNESLVNNNNSSTHKVRSYETTKTLNKILPKTSLLKNKIPPERVAAIAEKRKFNMKLRDIIEDCLDKLDEPSKSDFENRKVLHKTKIMQSKKQQVGSYLAKDPELPGVQDYTIAFLEARMKKMEVNLLNKIGENSQRIMELRESVAPSCRKRTVHTQTSLSEDVHKRQLYHELSKYLSQEANSLIYEELFINKYTKDSSTPKRRKRR